MTLVSCTVMITVQYVAVAFFDSRYCAYDYRMAKVALCRNGQS